MLLEVYRCRRRAAMLGGTALLALLNALAPASAQDQPPTNPPAQTQAPQESTPPSPAPPAPSVQAPPTPAPTPSPQISGSGSKLPQINIRGARRPAPRAAARRPAPATIAPTTVPPVRRPKSSPREATASIRRAAIFTPRLARHRTRSATIRFRRCRKAPMRQSRRCCCKRPAYRRILPPVAFFTCVTITPMCNSASTA